MNEQEKQSENKQLGMMWFYFYFSWRIYLSLVFAVLSMLSAFNPLYLIDIVLIATLLIGFRMKKAWLYKYNVFVLISEWFYMFSRVFDRETSNDQELLLITLAIFGIVGFFWFFFNYRYFKKRKSSMFYVEKEKPPRKFFQFITIIPKKSLIWLKRYLLWIILALVVCLIVYWIIPKYYFINSSVRCNRITGNCEKRSGSNWQLLK